MHPRTPPLPALHARRIALGALGALATLATLATLAGCGAAASGDESDGAPTTTISPLGELMGWTNDSPEESRRKQLAVEQLVAECMREEGWEYTPVDYGSMDRSEGSPDMDLQMNDPQAFGEKHGYGIVFYYELYEEENIGKNGGGAGPMATAVGRGPDDPNAEYVESLSTSEQEEYNASLYGKPIEASVDGGFGTAAGVAVRPEDQGCYGRSSAEVYPQNDAANDPDVQERMNDYWQNIEESPEMTAAYEAWAACMAEEVDLVGPTGAKVANPNDMWTYLDGLKNEAMGLESEPMTEEEFDKGGEYYTASMDEDGNGVAWVGEPTPISEADLIELKATEIELWKFDHACAEDARIGEIRMEAEQRFVDELRAEFPELAGDDQ
jgi:hypothetical protein